MEAIELEAKVKSAVGTRASRRYRSEGMLPANLYNGKLHKQVLLNYKDFVRSAEKSYTSQVFVLKSDQSDVNGSRVVIKEIQKDFLKNRVLHVDLYKLEDSSEVKVLVPLRIVGEAPGVKIGGGVMVQSARQIAVSCLPQNIPTILEVDISTLNVGKRIKTGDLQLPSGVVLRSDPMEVVVGIISGRAEVEEAKPAEAAAAAPAATGDAAKADGAKKPEAAADKAKK